MNKYYVIFQISKIRKFDKYQIALLMTYRGHKGRNKSQVDEISFEQVLVQVQLKATKIQSVFSFSTGREETETRGHIRRLYGKRCFL